MVEKDIFRTALDRIRRLTWQMDHHRPDPDWIKAMHWSLIHAIANAALQGRELPPMGPLEKQHWKEES